MASEHRRLVENLRKWTVSSDFESRSTLWQQVKEVNTFATKFWTKFNEFWRLRASLLLRVSWKKRERKREGERERERKQKFGFGHKGFKALTSFAEGWKWTPTKGGTITFWMSWVSVSRMAWHQRTCTSWPLIEHKECN